MSNMDVFLCKVHFLLLFCLFVTQSCQSMLHI